MRYAVAVWIACSTVLIGQEPSRDEPARSREAPAEDRLLRSLLDAHNAERRSADLPPLALDETLSRAAGRHAEDMADRGEMSHEGGDGSSPADRAKREGYHGLRVGENVARGQRDVEEVMLGWMESPGHKKNILGDYTQMGAARRATEEGEPYWCVVFGTPIPLLDPKEAADDLLGRINAARRDADKPPLKSDPKLAEVAKALAEDYARSAAKPKEERTPPDLKGLLEKAGVSYRSLTQNLAVGPPTAEDLTRELLEDEERKALVMGDARSVGIGYARDADETPCWCLLLVEE